MLFLKSFPQRGRKKQKTKNYSFSLLKPWKCIKFVGSKNSKLDCRFDHKFPNSKGRAYWNYVELIIMEGKQWKQFLGGGGIQVKKNKSILSFKKKKKSFVGNPHCCCTMLGGGMLGGGSLLGSSTTQILLTSKERLNISIGQQKEVQIITDHKKISRYILMMWPASWSLENREESDDRENTPP